MSDGPQLQTEARDPMLGTLVAARFRIDAVLGRGGMSTVYLAQHLQLDRAVALKLMNGNVALDRKVAERFRREVKVCSALQHPNIVKVHASGVSSEGQPYVVMDYVQGETLSQRLSGEGHLDQAVALPLLLQIARGLACAHESGIVHRDVKPSNVMLCVDEGGATRALVVDFGLSKFITPEDASAQAQTATVMQGSPLYMSPEQCQNSKTDFRTDVYSFGCLMYEVLSGSPPFKGDSAFALMYEKVHAAVPPFDPRLAISSEMESIVFRCLEKLPEDRYATAGDIVAALEDIDRQKSPRPGPRNATRTAATTASFRSLLVPLPMSIGLALAVLTLCLCVDPVSFMPSDEIARQFGLTLNKLGQFRFEADFYQKYAERKLAESGFKPTEVGAVNPQYDKVSTYSQFTIYAIRAAAQAYPEGQKEFATKSFIDLRNLLRGDKTGGIWLSAKTLRLVLRDNVVAMELIPEIDTKPLGIVGHEGIGLGQMLDQHGLNDLAERVLLRSLKILKNENRENWHPLNSASLWLADNYLNRGSRKGGSPRDLERAISAYDECLYYRKKNNDSLEFYAVLHAHKAVALRLLRRTEEAQRQDAQAIRLLNQVDMRERPEAYFYFWNEVQRVLTYENDPVQQQAAAANRKKVEDAVANHQISPEADARLREQN